MEFHVLCHGLRRILYGYQVTEADLVVISLMEDMEVRRQDMQNDGIEQRALTRL